MDISKSDDFQGASTDHQILRSANHRTKLTSLDVKLILYLIVYIKPFKYVGDRKISQTKKWELIQSQYEELKRHDTANNIINNVNDEVIVPTVRTLQRQLANAIKKARVRRSASGPIKPHGAPTETASSHMRHLDRSETGVYLFNFISRQSSISELEQALLELHELSEKLKNGKTASSTVEYQEIPLGLPTIKSDDDDDPPRLSSSAESILKQFNESQSLLQSELHAEVPDTSKIFPLMELLIHQNQSFQSEQKKLIHESMQAILTQNQHLHQMIERFQHEIETQNKLTRDLLVQAIERVGRRDPPSTLKSLHELLN